MTATRFEPTRLPEQGEFKYFAFISYSHADAAWGAWLHRKLETYRVPKSLVGTTHTRSGQPVPARLFPIFRDREELPTSTDLGTMLRQALDDSRYLVVICTPRSAASKWVNEEVLHFKRSGRGNRVLCLIADGEPNASAEDHAKECFPPAVRHALNEDGELDLHRLEEPIAADARPQGDGKQAALLKLIAGLAEVGLDELRRRDHERARRTMRRWLAAAMILILLFASLAGLAVSQRNRALAEEQRAQQTLSASDFYQADEWMRRDEPHQALLHLARAVTTDAGNLAARLRLMCALTQEAWPYEAETPTGPGEATPVRDLLLVREGKHVVVQTSQGYQQVWEVSGKALSPPLLHDEVEWAGRLSYLAVTHPEGEKMASGGHDGKVRLWKLPTGESLSASEDLGGQVIALQTDTSGKTIAAGTDSGRVIWLDWEGGTASLTETSTGRVTALSLNAEGTALAAAIEDGVVKLWSKGTDHAIDLHHSARVNTLAFEPEGRWLVTGCHDGEVCVWDVSSGKLREKHVLASAVGSITFSPTRPTFAVGWGYYGESWQVSLFSLLEDGSLKHEHTVDHPLRDVGHRIGSSGFGSQAFSPDGKHLLTWNAMDREVRCWTVSNGKAAMMPLLHAGPVGAAAFRNHDEILTGAADGLVRVWKWSEPVPPKIHALPAGYWIDGTWSATEKKWIGIGRGTADEGLLIVAERRPDAWLSRPISLPDIATCLSVSPASESALLAMVGGGIVRADLASGTTHQLVGWENIQADILRQIDPKRFVVSTEEGNVLCGSIDSTTPDSSFELGDKVRTLELDPTRRWAVAGLDLEHAWWLPLDALSYAKKLTGHEQTVSAAAFAEKGHRFATADYAGYIQAWTVENTPRLLFSGRQDAEVISLAFNKDGTILASGGRDDRVNCWAADREGELLSSVKTASWVERLEFAEDRRHLLIVMQGGRIGILDSFTGRWVMNPVTMGADGFSSGWTHDGIWAVDRQGTLREWTLQAPNFSGLSALAEILSRSRFTPSGGIQREPCSESLPVLLKQRGMADDAFSWWMPRIHEPVAKPQGSLKNGK